MTGQVSSADALAAHLERLAGRSIEPPQCELTPVITGRTQLDEVLLMVAVMAMIADVLVGLVGHLLIGADDVGAITFVRFNVDAALVAGRTRSWTVFTAIRRVSVVAELFLPLRQVKHVR